MRDVIDRYSTEFGVVRFLEWRGASRRLVARRNDAGKLVLTGERAWYIKDLSETKQ